MKMKTRLLTLLLALAMTASLAACGGEDPSAPAPEETPVEESAPQTAPEGGQDLQIQPEDPEDGESAEEAEPEQSADQPQQPADTTQKPQTGSGSAGGAEKPQSKPVETPAEEETPAPEQTPESAASVDLAAFAADLAADQTNWPGMMAVEGEPLETYYPGLSALGPKQCVVQVAMISASAVEIALVETASAADVDAAKAIFQARIDYQVGDGESPGGLLYPASVELWQNNARIVSNGNYVMLVVFENADGVVDSFNALFA